MTIAPTFLAGPGGWPRRLPPRDALPPTLPDGRPWPRISIVTPTLNQGAYIEDCILSVLHQDYPAVEHIIWDGGSTDGTGAILDRYQGRLARVVRQRDEGQSDAINKAMALTSGDILTWLNSDDMLAPGALAAVARAFAASGADMVAGASTILYGHMPASHGLPSVADGPLPLAELVDIDRGWLTGRFFYQPEVMFTRALWQRAGGAVRKDLHYSMDYDMWIRFAEAGARIHTIGQPVCVFRHTPEQKTASKDAYMPELRREAEAAARRTGLAPPPREAAPPRLGRNLRLVTLHRAPPETAATPLSRLAEACQEAWIEVVPVHLGGADAPGNAPGNAPIADRLGQILSRISWQGPDMVLVEDLRGLAGADALVESLAGRWPTLLFADGPGWPAAVPEGLAGVVDLRAGAVRPAVPRAALLDPADRMEARRRLGLPGEGTCVLLLGADAWPDAATALARPGLTLRADAWTAAGLPVVAVQGPERGAALAAFDAVVALHDAPALTQILAEAAAAGAVPLALGAAPVGGIACESLEDVAARLAALDPWQGTHARLAALAELSPFAAYRDLFLLWRAWGLIDRLGAKDKIDFRPLPQPLRPALGAWAGL